MSKPTTNADRLLDLAEAVCDKVASQEDIEELDSALLANDESLQRYLAYCRMHVALKLDLLAQDATQAVCKQIDIGRLVASPNEIDGVKDGIPSTPFLPFLSTAMHGSFGYLSSGWPVAYLVATVIFGIASLIGSVVYVSHPGQVAQQSVSLPSPLSSHPSPLSPLPSVVGQITSMIDCKLKERTGDRGQGTGTGKQDSPLSPLPSLLLIRLGDKFALASGLMEITYNTGAKVILQGPATYVVDAKNGGFINIGRLTGIMEAPDAKGFILRTPTAVVADLGTEFGVEVDRDGSTASRVFRGAVSIRAAGDNNDTAAGSTVTVLRENESARTERDSGDGRRIKVHRVAVNPDVFVRRLEKPTPLVDVLAWFRMGEDEPNAHAGRPAGNEIHSHGRKYPRLDRRGSPTYGSDTEAPGSTLSMTFHGGSNGEYFGSPRFPFIPNDYFILEAWVKLPKLNRERQVIVTSGDGDRNGYCLLVNDGRWFGTLHGVSFIDSGVACEIGKWTHLALVCERGKVQLWVNGRPQGSVVDVIPNMPDGPFSIGGEVGYPETGFNGEIDEVRLSTFIAPFRPEMLLLGKADHTQSKTVGTTMINQQGTASVGRM
jgi:hypothetical protein